MRRPRVVKYEKEAADWMALLLSDEAEEAIMDRAEKNAFFQQILKELIVKASPEQALFVSREALYWAIVVRRDHLAGKDPLAGPFTERQRIEEILVGSSGAFRPLHLAVAARFRNVAEADKAIRRLQPEGLKNNPSASDEEIDRGEKGRRKCCDAA